MKKQGWINKFLLSKVCPSIVAAHHGFGGYVKQEEVKKEAKIGEIDRKSVLQTKTACVPTVLNVSKERILIIKTKIGKNELILLLPELLAEGKHIYAGKLQ